MRGMKKWLPFKSLKGQYEMLDEMKEKRRRVEKPELSIDEMEEMNRVLLSSVPGDLVKVRFHLDGNIRECTEMFKKCDTYQQKLYLKSFALPFSDVLEIKNQRNFEEDGENRNC